MANVLAVQDKLGMTFEAPVVSMLGECEIDPIRNDAQTERKVAGLDYAGVCLPAIGVSGDYYDFIPLPSGRLAFVLADVCGKGLLAASVADILRTAVRAYTLETDWNCGEVLTRVNQLLFETSVHRFATMFYAIYAPAERTLVWTNAGHCAPVLVRGLGQVCARLDSLTLPVGILPAIAATQQTIQMDPGDRIIVVSDGITEACDCRGEEFGDGRLLRMVRKGGFVPAARLCSSVLDAVKHFSRGCLRADDRSVVVVNVLTES